MSPRTCLTLEQKLQVHLKLKQNPGMNNPMLAEWIYATFKARVSRATLARLRNLPSSYFSHVDLSATKRRRVKFPKFERELREFFFQNEAKTAMADDVLLLKAHELAERLGIDSTQLRFSNGWLQSFKKRNGIRSHVLHGEGGAVEDDAVRDARLELQELVAQFAPDDAFNFDETALFYRLAPNRTLLEVRLATGAIVKTEKRVVDVRFSYKQRVFVEIFIVLDLDNKFDVVMGMPWLARHDPVIDWKKRTLVRFGRDSGTESDGPVTAAHAPAGARGSPVKTAVNAAVLECPRSARGRAQVRPTSAVLPTSEDAYMSVPGTNTRVQVRMGQSLTRRGQVDDDAPAPGADAPSVMRGSANEWRRAGLDIARPQTGSAGEGTHYRAAGLHE
ncbi:uncharacterized protein IUM83_01249 [Phytophthora cinnamomi]|uniref:uncharacterized protein n=1 Tax=Phytophthora cinnamomi TaxID=4785 RepID=UPI0035596968|nr:hypothetical protein IUM83_01249 [Phytophthora cinnamomi]